MEKKKKPLLSFFSKLPEVKRKFGIVCMFNKLLKDRIIREAVDMDLEYNVDPAEEPYILVMLKEKKHGK